MASNVEIVLNASFTQWAAHNVDHNVCTLDGKDTWMSISTAGMISPMTVDNQQRIKRIRYGRKAPEIVSKAKIPISWYEPHWQRCVSSPQSNFSHHSLFHCLSASNFFGNFCSFLPLTTIRYSGMDLCNYINMAKAILGKVKYSWRLSLIKIHQMKTVFILHFCSYGSKQHQ